MWATLMITGKIILAQIFIIPISFVIAMQWQKSAWVKKRDWVFVPLVLVSFLILDSILTLLTLAYDSKTVVVFN